MAIKTVTIPMDEKTHERKNGVTFTWNEILELGLSQAEALEKAKQADAVV